MTSSTKSTPHGTTDAYTNHGCHCKRCKKAWAAYVRDAKLRRAARLRADPSLAPHGRASTYNNWVCRCKPCTAANTATNSGRRQVKPSRNLHLFSLPKGHVTHLKTRGSSESVCGILSEWWQKENDYSIPLCQKCVRRIE